MKLLTTIAAVLISISAFSQNYVEHNEGTFTQNGEELSMEQIENLTKLYDVGEGNLRRARESLRLAQKPNPRMLSNTLNCIGGVATGFVSLGGFVIGNNFLTDDGNWLLEFYHPPTGYAFIALGVFSVSSGVYLFSKIGNKHSFNLRSYKQFNKVADKLNEAIKAANQ